MNRIALLATATIALTSLATTAVLPSAPHAAAVPASQDTLLGPSVHHRIHPDAPDAAWFDSAAMAELQAVQVDWLVGRATRSAETTCRAAGFDGADVAVIDQFVEFDAPWVQADDGAFAGPARVGVRVERRCR